MALVILTGSKSAFSPRHTRTSHMEFKECATGTKAFTHLHVPQWIWIHPHLTMLRKRKLENARSALGNRHERPARDRGTSTVRKASRTSRSDIHSLSHCHLLILLTSSNTSSTCTEPLSASQPQTSPPRRSWMASSRVSSFSTSQITSIC